MEKISKKVPEYIPPGRRSRVADISESNSSSSTLTGKTFNVDDNYEFQ